MQRSAVRLAVPWAHPIMPGRPSQRGYLYRPSYVNAYTRLKMIHWAQQTETEHKTLNFAQWPDQYMMLYYVLPAAIIMMWYMAWSHPISFGANRDRTLLGGMNLSEVWKRNSDMSAIFDKHHEEARQMRALVERPEVLSPPEGSLWKNSWK